MTHPRKFKSRRVRLSQFLVRLLVVSNYPTTECFERPRKSLTENGAEVTSTDWTGTGASRFNEFDGVALSCSPDDSAGNRVIGNFVKLLR